MTNEVYLTRKEAAQLIRERYGTSVGKAEALVEEACEARDVRTRPKRMTVEDSSVYLTQDDGLVGFDPTPGTINPRGVSADGTVFVEGLELEKEDLLYWADQRLSATSPPPHTQPDRDRQPRAKFLQHQAEQRLLSLFPESRGVPPANLRPKDIVDRVNHGLSPKAQFLRDTVARAVENLKEKAGQNQ